MRTTTILKRSMTAIACACALGLASQASALTIASPEYVGSITPNHPSNPANEVARINFLIDLAINTSTSSGGQAYVRSGNFPLGLPDAILAGAVKDDTDPSNIVDVTGFAYLLGKYDAAQSGALVFYVGDLSGNQELPTEFNGHELSHWSLYNATGGGGNLPDGGATVALLGLGLVALGASRRFIKN